ncbi:unnamed protein product [Symbiodinium natans]|uniref:Uncharacterized protein n=1 Tax=Symbiodinium natans TaxID=878477 RepID=A0A812Q903_9DINO|nr:unnamed protein product [Symbiodinium natans]
MADFWDRNSSTEWFDMDLKKTVPLVLHGDDAECHRRRSFMVVTWGSAVVHATPWDSKFVVYVGDNSQCDENCYTALDMWTTWSLVELMLGHWLDVDPWGRPFNRGKKGTIANGWRAVLAFHKGDEKYMQKAYHMINSATSKNICFVCQVWMMTTSDFILNGCRANPFIRLPGFHISMVTNDWLHIIDLTLIPDAAASALLELTENSNGPFPGRDQDDRLRAAYVQFSALCKQHNISHFAHVSKQLTGETKKNNVQFPTIAQKHMNGAEAVVMAKWLMGICLAEAARNPGDVHSALRAVVFINLAQMRDAISLKRDNPFCTLSEANIQKLQQSNYLYHSALNSLAVEAIDHGRLLWKIRPKVHKADHLAFDLAPRVNPLVLSCYMDEDAVGKMKRLAMKSHPQQLGRQVLARYAAYVCCRWLRMLER